MDRQHIRHILLGGIIAFAVITVFFIWVFFSAFSTSSEARYIYIDSDDTRDSVFSKLSEEAAFGRYAGIRTLCLLSRCNPRPGRYAIAPGISAFQLFRNLRNGNQSPVRLTIPVVRTSTDLAMKLSRELEGDSASWATALLDSSLCSKFGVTPATVISLFIPDTYEVYWTTTPDGLLKRMKKESETFWTDKRKRQAEKAGLSPTEVITLASIVEQETADNQEKPMVAGMYLNRLHNGMKLQADPTVKFALKQFGLKRILHEHLSVENPYNTYRNEGLPPGPICIPSRASIESVLQYVEHPYLYMCAKEDFSGSHNFAKTYAEHLDNARKYADALNRRGIK
ncbi:MAG TPA: endolytic transglycosylase MltG [Alloprevotella sp.]|nr:endolytic transglycosylase MltG [Alloprevotella sp.]